MPAGQPTAFREEMVEQAQKLAKLGATDMEVADFFGVDVRTIYRWKNTQPEFCQALNIGKEDADSRVERSLFQRAIGYEQDAVKIFMPAGSPDPVYAPYRERVQPDTTACIFWLKNRKRNDWRDKTDTEVSGEVVVKRVVSDL